MTMKENQNGNSFDSISFGKETDPLAFGSKVRFELNDSRMDSNHTKFEANDTDGNSTFKVTDASSMDDEKVTIGAPKKAGQNGLPHHGSVDNENGAAVVSPRKKGEDERLHQRSIWSKDTDSLSSDSSDIDKERRSPEHETFDTVEEFAYCDQNYSTNSSSPLFSEKNALECDLPDMEVCYEEIDPQILKDLSVDVAMHQKDVNLIESCMDYIDPFEAEEDSSLDSDSSSTADQCRSKEENDGRTLVSQERLDTCLENSLEMDTIEHCVPENEAGTSESFKAKTHSSAEDSIVDGKLQIEDFGTQISLGTDGGKKVLEVADQSLHQAATESPDASSAEAGGTGNDVQVNCPLYNSNIENGSVDFNFSSREGALVGNVLADDIDEQPADTGDVHKDVNDENLPGSKESKAECTSDADGGSATRHDQRVTSEGENGHDGSPGHKQSNPDDIPTDEPAESTSKSPGPTNDTEPTAPNQDGRDTGNLPAFSHLQHYMGETSFSAASLISYSGPIAFSGSLSHRSDGSTTSGKSFAFPILQSEWNSSPVRMAKAERRQFRKHKGWRSGVLCCRF